MTRDEMVSYLNSIPADGKVLLKFSEGGMDYLYEILRITDVRFGDEWHFEQKIIISLSRTRRENDRNR